MTKNEGTQSLWSSNNIRGNSTNLVKLYFLLAWPYWDVSICLQTSIPCRWAYKNVTLWCYIYLTHEHKLINKFYVESIDTSKSGKEIMPQQCALYSQNKTGMWLSLVPLYVTWSLNVCNNCTMLLHLKKFTSTFNITWDTLELNTYMCQTLLSFPWFIHTKDFQAHEPWHLNYLWSEMKKG